MNVKARNAIAYNISVINMAIKAMNEGELPEPFNNRLSRQSPRDLAGAFLAGVCGAGLLAVAAIAKLSFEVVTGSSLSAGPSTALLVSMLIMAVLGVVALILAATPSELEKRLTSITTEQFLGNMSKEDAVAALEKERELMRQQLKAA